MHAKLIDSQASYLTASSPPNHDRAAIRTECEWQEEAISAHFHECRLSGRPHIDYNPGAGLFRYVYFDRSRPPSSELMDQLDALGVSFEMWHLHVLKGSVFRECLGSIGAIAYQGRFSNPDRACPPEQIESFVSRLSRLLPSYDRPAAVKSLTGKAISAGCFTYAGEWHFGDEDLESDAQKAYDAWCMTQGRPPVTLDLEDEYFRYEVTGNVLNGNAVAAIDSLARSAGLKNIYRPNSKCYLEVLGDDVPPIFDHPDQVPPFVARLTEILSDPLSHGPDAE